MAKKRSTGSEVTGNVSTEIKSQKTRLSQSDVPAYTLDQALEVPKAIADNFASEPTKPLQVAKAMGVQPNSGGFRGKCGAALAYGLTNGGPNASEIAIEPLGKRIVRPLQEGDDMQARREALLKPRVIGEFLRKYNGSPLPKTNIAHNVLMNMGVPEQKTEKVLSLILESAEQVGFLTEINNKRYVDFENVLPQNIGEQAEESISTPDDEGNDAGEPADNLFNLHKNRQPVTESDESTRADNKRRVFITHGKNQAFIEPIQKLLGFGELEAVISGQRQSVAQPVPDKVVSDMRSCGAAIIHVDAELKLIDQEAEEHTVLNPNVLIEIGAAMALYGRRFILLVKEGVQLPSNLQGLYEVRYSGEQLDGAATIKLLEAINDIKNHPLPARYSGKQDSK